VLELLRLCWSESGNVILRCANGSLVSVLVMHLELKDGRRVREWRFCSGLLSRDNRRLAQEIRVGERPFW
jgi:hypothetical protein